MGLFDKKEKPTIVKVKCLGVRTAMETRVLSTVNSTIYCFLVEYSDGSRAVIDCEGNDKKLPELLMYIDMDS